MSGGHGHGHVTVRRSPDAPNRGARCDPSHRARMAAVGPLLGGRLPGPYGPLAPRWEAPHRAPVPDGPARSVANPRGARAVDRGLPEDLSPPRRAGTARRPGSAASPAVAAWAPGGPARDAACPGG